MRDREPARPHASGATVDLDVGHHRDHRADALGVGEAAAAHHRALAAIRIRTSRPPGLVGGRLDDGRVPRILHVLHPERHRIDAERMRDLVDERLAREVGFGSERIAQMRGAEGRRALE